MEKLLEQILSELKGLKESQDRLESSLKESQDQLGSSLKEGQNRLESRMCNLESNQDRLESKVNSLTSSLIENLAPYFENIAKHIDDSNEKVITYVDDKTEALNKRIFAVETDIQRLTRQ